MNDLIYMLKQAFEAGQQSAAKDESGGRCYHPDFKQWLEMNKDDIRQLQGKFNITDQSMSGLRCLIAPHDRERK